MTALIHRNPVLRALVMGLIAMTFAVSPMMISNAQAQGEHSRRIAAELTVLAGDIRQLQLSDTLPQHAIGLRERILGSLNSLDILARLADQERGALPTSRHALLLTLRSDLENNRISAMTASITKLLKDYPLQLPPISVADTTLYKNLHKQLCAGCHDHPDKNVNRPAYNLSEQTQVTDPIEMFARMLVGVRGDRVTGIDNPLSDIQIVGMMAYYRQPESIKNE